MAAATDNNDSLGHDWSRDEPTTVPKRQLNDAEAGQDRRSVQS